MRVFGKRGLENKLFFSMWELIVLGMVIIALAVSVRSIATGGSFWKKYHSADIAMTTDLMHAGQGDFVVNYNLKQIHQNFLTNLLDINKFMLTIFLNNDSVFVYDGLDDKFPQSFVFAQSKNIHVIRGNITSDYITLYKEGDTIGMTDYYSPSYIVCPAIDTSMPKDKLKITSIALESGADTTAVYITDFFKMYGANTNANELAIYVDNSTTGSVIYNSAAPEKSGKLACLVQRAAVAQYPDMTFSSSAYSGTFDMNTAFSGSRSNYNNWIIINTNMTGANITQLLGAAVAQYYGITG